jgi:hypothetical protein
VLLYFHSTAAEQQCLSRQGIKYLLRFYGHIQNIRPEEAPSFAESGTRLIATSEGLTSFPGSADEATKVFKLARDAGQPGGTPIFFDIEVDADDNDIDNKIILSLGRSKNKTIRSPSNRSDSKSEFTALGLSSRSFVLLVLSSMGGWLTHKALEEPNLRSTLESGICGKRLWTAPDRVASRSVKVSLTRGSTVTICPTSPMNPQMHVE